MMQTRISRSKRRLCWRRSRRGYGTFYANGTLTKYEVVDTDAAPPKMALNVVPTRVPSIRMSSVASNWRKKAKNTPS
ncbi:hypothetical protein PsorP6_010597 [Peronosclerospora sorghi]|uniref:Uncharacterized protein n=1 Tax=Peronosclerospora sorghi TaxID=230839 RepID=A0ACC0VWV8_9STRA|nr:hypothetical protein PsorP6_010597 [Peronosclerospora sorghi]